MLDALPLIYLARHGETAWSLTGQHTGRTDLPLTDRGQRNARRLGIRLRGVTFAQVLSSPLQRAWTTCQLAGLGPAAEIEADLVEWDYGDFEGRRTAEILQDHPGWELFRDGCPGGESVAEVAARADRVVRRLRDIPGPALVYSSGHILRVLAARWLELEASAGRCLALSTASLSILGNEGVLRQPVIRLWNDTTHVEH